MDLLRALELLLRCGMILLRMLLLLCTLPLSKVSLTDLFPSMPAPWRMQSAARLAHSVRPIMSRFKQNTTTYPKTCVSLPCWCRQAFQHYVAQDAFFLKAFAQAYALALGQTPVPEERNTLQALLNGVDAELNLHKGYAKVTVLFPTASTNSTQQVVG